MSHNEAVFIYLLGHPNQWVPLPELREFTRAHCETSCYVVHSRVSDLRKLGWKIENNTPKKGESSYKIRVSHNELTVLREIWKQVNGRFLPSYSVVQERVKDKSKTISLFH